jgi:hypothetical protein
MIGGLAGEGNSLPAFLPVTGDNALIINEINIEL